MTNEKAAGQSREFIFTFGFGQRHQNGYHVIKARSSMDAREEMHRRFGKEWSMMYDSREEAGVERWGLREIK